ncbi:hypothetical protein [Clostridium folliculivorans]|uniref:Uncharacterized protein n=1 Tax=Clostridium folliculivorans TaxID=2886038 RepID=A0A9W6D9W2_9CLOT|nr:hypothetical protein [Clostridium folliculivorans]GKU24197.1 hypothetical protein CFOLD11_10230 [Clostridium folliculivorans]GKU30302.1 hypothetical protein CFB3_24090 [Clostridium folliculivorans]
MELQTNSKTTLTKIRGTRVALISMGIALIEVIMLAFMPIIAVDGTKYCGWKIAFYYWGKQYIYNYHEFGFNLILSSSILLPIIAVIATGIIWRKSTGLKRSVFQFVVAVLLIYCGIAYLNALPLAEKTASETMFKTIYYAKNSNSYILTSYPLFNFAVCTFAAVVQIVTGILNIKAKKDN